MTAEIHKLQYTSNIRIVHIQAEKFSHDFLTKHGKIVKIENFAHHSNSLREAIGLLKKYYKAKEIGKRWCDFCQENVILFKISKRNEYISH